jgi:hypothetical protein
MDPLNDPDRASALRRVRGVMKPEPPYATCSGLRPDHGGWKVRVGAFAMYEGWARMGEADTIRGVWLAALAIFGRLDRGDAGSAPGGLRYLVGPLQRGESDVTRCNMTTGSPFLAGFFTRPAQ